MTGNLETKIRHAPRGPGVYLMKDGTGVVLYVGKARDLKARVKAYFGRTDTRAMIPFLVSRVQDIEFILTGTEKEALILENTLIKENRPRYNIDFRDDKSYYNIRINPAEPFPRFQMVRRPKKDGARYFGPYPSGTAAKETLRFVQTILRLRSCRDRELKNRRRPCLEYQIGRCVAPCVGRIDVAAYQCLVRDGIAFLEGKEKALIEDLRARMNEAAQTLNFEEAAAIRDRISAIEETLERQRVVSATGRNRDVFGFYRRQNLTQVVLVYVRSGRMIGQKAFPLLRISLESGDILSSLLARYYDGISDIPDEVIIPFALEDSGVLSEWLTEKKGRGVRIVVPKRGETFAVLDIAARNAENAFRTQHFAVEDSKDTLRMMFEILQLRKIPKKIECFDISNIGGKYAVGSLVAFRDGIPSKEGYRRFRIRTVPDADDYAMMYEVMGRRYRDGKNLPDLIMVDGGKGQLRVALAVLKDLCIDGVDVIGLAKGRQRAHSNPPRRFGQAGISEDLKRSSENMAGIYKNNSALSEGHRPVQLSSRDRRLDAAEKTEDHVYLAGRKDPVYLFRWPAVLLLLQRIRDEAHRFAVTYHRKVREKEDLRSILEQIPGIGPKRRTALLVFFGDLLRIRTASVRDLQSVEGVGAGMAERIRRFLDSC